MNRETAYQHRETAYRETVFQHHHCEIIDRETQALLDFYIDSSLTNESTFEYWLSNELYIKSISLKNISFYNSWWTTQDGTMLLMALSTEGEKETAFIPERGRYNINDVCSFFNKILKAKK